MSYEAELEAIEGRMNTNWTTTPIVFENVDYVPVDGTPYVELFVKSADAVRASLGPSALHRIVGVILVNIHVPKGTGTNLARTYGDTIAAIFRDQAFSGVVCRAASVRSIGPVNEWFVVSVTIPYYRNEVFTIT